MLSWIEYKEIRYKFFGEKRPEARKNFHEYVRIMKKKYGKTEPMNCATGPAEYKQTTVSNVTAGIVANYCTPCNAQPPANQVYDVGHSHTVSWPSVLSSGDVTYSFGTCEAAPPMPPGYAIPDWSVNQEKGNNPMNYATANVVTAPQTSETQDQRKYLTQRLSEVYHTKRDPLEQKFGLYDDDAPTSSTELAERLKEGKYTLRTDKEVGRWAMWFEHIQWRSPDRKRDDEGFKAAVDDLKAERQKALDIIKIEDPKAGLEAIKALEAWEPKNAAN